MMLGRSVRTLLATAPFRSPFAPASYSTTFLSDVVVELREYDVFPEHLGAYLQASAQAGKLRKRLLPLRLFGTPEVGDALNRVQHLYFYRDLQQRQEARDAAAKDPDWQTYIATIRPFLSAQKSTLLSEYHFNFDIPGMAQEAMGPEDDASPPGHFEFCRYRIDPKNTNTFAMAMRRNFEQQHSSETGSHLCTALKTAFGPRDEVLAIWRHDRLETVMENSGTTWFHSIQDELVTTYNSSIVKPASFSNWR